MLSKNWLFTVFFLLSLFPGIWISFEFVKFYDELLCAFLLLLSLTDIFTSGRTAWRQLRPLAILLGIGMCYALYSSLFFRFNSFSAILSDLIVETKPYLTFLVIYCMRLRLLPAYYKVAKALCWANIACMLFFYAWGHGALLLPFGHLAQLGSCVMLSALTYYYCSVDDEGKLAVRDLVCITLMLLIGLICGRSRYYGEFILAVIMILYYRQGMFAHVSWRLVVGSLAMILVIGLAAWSKIEYYFVQGVSSMVESGSLDEMSESFARPVMYVTGGMILLDYFPFGPGLASFGSFASAHPYSQLYHEYGLDKVWGLSSQYSSFVCDAYYPTLCQFGIVGLLGFFLLFGWMLRRLLQYDRMLGSQFRHYFVIGFILVVFVMIESIGSTAFIQMIGMYVMTIMALLCQPQNTSANKA